MRPSRAREKITSGIVVAPGTGEEGREHDVVERQREREQERGKQRLADHRQRHEPEDLPGAGAEVERRFLELRIERLQARADHDGGIGEAEQEVAEPDRHHAALGKAGAEGRLGRALQRHQHQEKRQADDDLGHHQRRGDHAGEEGAAEEARVADERERGERAEDDRGTRRRQATFSDSARPASSSSVGGEGGVPAQREAAPDVGDRRVVERIDDQGDDRHVEEGVAEARARRARTSD